MWVLIAIGLVSVTSAWLWFRSKLQAMKEVCLSRDGFGSVIPCVKT